MHHITPILIKDGYNVAMIELQSFENVKNVVFALNGDSVSGPDGFTL